MKKITTIFLLLSLMLALFACQSSENESSEDNGDSTEESQIDSKENGTENSSAASDSSENTSSATDHIHSYSDTWKSNEESHWIECACGEKSNEKSHTFGDWSIITEATETAVGNRKHTCTDCGFEQTEEIPMIEHIHNFTQWDSDETSHWQICDCGDISDKTAHNMGEKRIDTPATCTADGSESQTCSDCGFAISTPISAKGHNFGIDGKCMNCDEKTEISITGSNIAPNGTYTTSQLYQQGGADVSWGWDDNAAIAYPDEDGMSLIDGIYGTGDYNDTAWIGFNMNCPDHIEKGYSSITFDLGSVNSINGVKINFGSTFIGSGVFIPTGIEILVSDDGSSFTSLGSAVPIDSVSEFSATTELVFPAVNAQYVQIRFVCNGFAFVSEVEIYA